jgi:hypothetical protein
MWFGLLLSVFLLEMKFFYGRCHAVSEIKFRSVNSEFWRRQTKVEGLDAAEDTKIALKG